jgi:hypothetical protein
MGEFVLISDAEIQGCIEYTSPHVRKMDPGVAAKRTLGL